MNPIFKTLVSKEILFELLEKICVKTNIYFLFDHNAFKKLMYHNLHISFFQTIKPCYYPSKRHFLTRTFTYNSFVNVLRQICKSQNITYTTHKKYNESICNIDYYIFY